MNNNDDVQMNDMVCPTKPIRRKRKYHETLNASLLERLSHLELCSSRKKTMKLCSSDNTTTISVSTTAEPESDNAIIDMEREREMVERYYKERNAMLTRAMFG